MAVGFFDAPPTGVEQWSGGPPPAGCSFWKIAGEGRAFYTAPAHHYNCAVGSHTHSIPLPADRQAELMETVGYMVENRYIEMSEVSGIPVLEKTPAWVAYAPADSAPFEPDIVIVAARAQSAMLLFEAAVRAGAITGAAQTLGRPACAAVPLAAKTNAAAVSLGCIGNRTFTGLDGGEMYLCIPGGKWAAVVEKLEEIRSANAAMETRYRERQARFPILS